MIDIQFIRATVDRKVEGWRPFGLRDEFLNRELFLHIDELRYVADRWRMDYNHYRPHSSLDYMAPAAFAAKCLEQGSATLRLTQDKENMCEILSRQLVLKTGAGHTDTLNSL